MGYEAKQCIGIHLGWGYDERELLASMKGYAKQALEELGHAMPTRLAAAPSKMPRPQYGAKVQYVEVDDTEALPDSKIKYLQRVLGKFLYYARAIGNTMLHALNDIAGSVAKGAKATEKAVRHFMNYAHSSPDAVTRFRASGMRLAGGSDAAYLAAPEARSRAGGCQAPWGSKRSRARAALRRLRPVNLLGSRLGRRFFLRHPLPQARREAAVLAFLIRALFQQAI